MTADRMPPATARRQPGLDGSAHDLTIDSDGVLRTTASTNLLVAIRRRLAGPSGLYELVQYCTLRAWR